MPDPDSTFFGFEADFVDSLRCIPMAVRLRLDVTGIKLKLNEWSKLGPADRLALANTSCRGPAELLAYGETLSRLVERTSGARPAMLPELPEAVWEDPARVPSQVTEQARALGLHLSQSSWASLLPLQRFALTKLSRPGHENLNFLPAMKEFGLASAG
ncbi:MAG: nitrate reductase associated protein [Fibrobacteria bacterium]